MKRIALILGLPFVLGAASIPAPTTGGAVYTPNSGGCVSLVGDQKPVVLPHVPGAVPQVPLARPQKPQGAGRALPPCGKIDNALLGAYRLPFPWKIQPVPAAAGK